MNTSISSQIEILEKSLTTPRGRLKSIALSEDNLLRKFRDFPFGDDWAPKRVKETQSSDDCAACTCGLPNKKYCMLTSVARREKSDRKKITWAPMSICKVL